MRRIAVLVATVALLGACAEDDSDPRANAFYVCAEFVERRLKSPASADFPNYFSAPSMVSGDAPTYTVRSYVDSENGFGANIRTRFTCTVTDIGDEWRLDNINL